MTIDDRDVELEFSIERFAYVWSIRVAAERHKTEHLKTNYVPHGGEQYELHCAESMLLGKYYEYGAQGNKMRKREFTSSEFLRKLQGVVERMIELPNTSLDEVDEHAGSIGQHLLVSPTKGVKDFAAQSNETAIDANGNVVGEVIILSDYRDR